MGLFRERRDRPGLIGGRGSLTATEGATVTLTSDRAIDCRIDWGSSDVEHGRLSASLKPKPDFTFMVEFDRLIDPLNHPGHEGWGKILLAGHGVVVSDVRLDAAQELRAFLDETVRQANRRAVDTRAREQRDKETQARAAAQREARTSAEAQAAAEHDAQLTQAFRRPD
jgi:hypothetical protein